MEAIERPSGYERQINEYALAKRVAAEVLREVLPEIRDTFAEVLEGLFEDLPDEEVGE